MFAKLIVAVILAAAAGFMTQSPGAAIGVFLAAFFIATDPVTGCITPRGRMIFAAGVAALALAIGQWSVHPDGVAFAGQDDLALRDGGAVWG